MEDEPTSSEEEQEAGEEGQEDNQSQASDDAQDREEEDKAHSRFNKGFPENLFKKFAQEPVKLRVHDIKIEGNLRTKDPVIEREFEKVQNAETSRELLQEVALALNRIQHMDIFEDCVISLEPGPVELPGTANVVVKVKEPDKIYTGGLGVFSKPETQTWTGEGSVRLKNALGYADMWDGTASYSSDGSKELSAGLAYPRFKGLPATFVARASISKQDWMKYSSYTERMVGASVGLVTGSHHDLSYNLAWRTLEDPNHVASHSVRRQLGHSLLSSIRYIFKVDKRDSFSRPTRGYAFRSATHVSGIGLDSNLLRFVRQELDLRCAIPMGFFNTALNLGISGGLIVPWGAGFQEKVTPISDRFFIGGASSLVCDLMGPSGLPGFRSRGLGPMDVRRATSTTVEGSATLEARQDSLGGDLGLTAFADLSFDLPFSFLRDQNIHGHCFVSVGSLFGLSEIDSKSMSWEKLRSATRVSAGAGIVIPTRLFRLEVNYCRVLRQFDWDHTKSGFQFTCAPPG